MSDHIAWAKRALEQSRIELTGPDCLGGDTERWGRILQTDALAHALIAIAEKMPDRPASNTLWGRFRGT